MQITSGRGGYIWTAASDCGRVVFSPIGNDRLIIDGRDVYSGRFCDAKGMVTDERPADDVAQVASDLIRDVRAHNDALQQAAREAAWAREDAREELIEWGIANTRGTAYDPNAR